MKGEAPGLSIGEVAKRLGEMWNGTASEDKQPFEKKAAKLKEKYEKVKIRWSVVALMLHVVLLFHACVLFTLDINEVYLSFLHHRKLQHIAKRPKEAPHQQEKPRLR